MSIAGIIAGIAWPVAHFYGEPRLGPILLVIAASYLFVPWSVVPNALLVRAMDFRSDFVINLAYAAANAALAIGLAWAGWSAESLAWAMLGASAVRAMVAQLLRPTPLPWPLRAEGLRGILSFGSASSLIYISGSVGVRSQDMVIGRLLGMAATGLYSRGAGLATQFHLLVMGAIGGIYYPAFARLRDEGKALGPYYQRVVAIHGAMVWPAMALLAVLAKPVVLLLYGPSWGGLRRCSPAWRWPRFASSPCHCISTCRSCWGGCARCWPAT